MKDLLKISALAMSLMLLAGCTPKPCCNFKTVEETSLSSALKTEFWEKGIAGGDIKRCFGNGLLNKYDRRVYLVYNSKKTDGRYCHIAFSDRPLAGTDRYKIVATSFEDETLTSDSCQLKALACLRPAAATRIAKEHNLVLDRSPIPVQKW